MRVRVRVLHVFPFYGPENNFHKRPFVRSYGCKNVLEVSWNRRKIERTFRLWKVELPSLTPKWQVYSRPGSRSTAPTPPGTPRGGPASIRRRRGSGEASGRPGRVTAMLGWASAPAPFPQEARSRTQPRLRARSGHIGPHRRPRGSSAGGTGRPKVPSARDGHIQRHATPPPTA